MGTSETIMGWVRDEIGRAVGLPRELGGIPLDEIGATGWGLYHAIRVGMSHLGLPLKGARAVVQGFGAVGYHTARFLDQSGVRLVAVSDSAGAIANTDGLSVGDLIAFKRQGRSVGEFAAGKRMEADALLSVDCEIWIPAARPDVITAANVRKLRTRIVAQGANIPATAEAEDFLHKSGVLVLPDFIANAGGVICAAMEYHNATEAAAFDAIENRISDNSGIVLERMASRGESPRAAALAFAQDRVRTAMKSRRWSTFY
jgi:glutamate dehydrogenase (NAD(P)+)